MKGKYRILVVLPPNSGPINDIKRWKYIKGWIYLKRKSLGFWCGIFFKLKILFRISKLVCIKILTCELSLVSGNTDGQAITFLIREKSLSAIWKIEEVI